MLSRVLKSKPVINIVKFAASLILLSIPFKLLKLHFILYLMTLILLYAYLGQCWNILYGYAGQLSFGHAAFLGIGAYVSSILLIRFGISPWIGMIVGGAICALFAFFMSFPLLKLRGAYFALATLGMAEVVRLIVLRLDFITGGGRGLLLPVVTSPWLLLFGDIWHWFLTALGMNLALLYISYRIEGSKLGMAFRAIKQDEEASSSVGVDVFKYKMIALLLSASLTGIGGTFYAQLVGYIRPDIILTTERSDEIVVVAVIGGIGTLWGPMLGSAILLSIRQLIYSLLGGTYMGVHLIVYGILIMIIIIFAPEGLYPTIKKRLMREFGEAKSRGTPS